MDVVQTALQESVKIDVGDTKALLGRLISEWRAARVKLELGTSATVMEVARCLSIDRGTAQRLNHIARITDVKPSDIANFPGVRAWQQVLVGIERVLGAGHPNYQTLSLACDHFAGWIRATGGSRSAVLRQFANEKPNQAEITAPESARARWVQACADSFGYCVDIRYDLQMARQSPGVDPPRTDLGSLSILKSCRGVSGSMPIAFVRAAYSPDHQVIEGKGGDDPRSFYVLKSLTTKPAPAILTTGDAFRQTIFVEPQWSSLSKPLDLAILHEERAAMKWVFGTPHEWYEFNTLNRHPCRKLVLERMVSHDIDSKCAVALRVLRTHLMLAHDEPWFDRIPDETPVIRIGSVDDAIRNPPLPGYAEAMEETFSRLSHWDRQDLVVYRVVIENPVPLAAYTITFDRVRQ